MHRALLFIVLALAACGNIARNQHDAGNGQHDDAAMKDSGDHDAMGQLPATPARETVGGAGRMTGATYTLDVEVGMPMPPQKATGAIHTIQPNTAVQQ
jgi:hypothetical protein